MATEFVSEAGRWYRADGTPCYTIIGTNGKERATTLRDARKLSLLPSVTTIMGAARKPALEMWLEEQAYQSAFTTPTLPGESYADWKRRVKDFAAEESTEARDIGTTIHGAIECAYRGEPIRIEAMPQAHAAIECVAQNCGDQQWHPERSFASGFGYAGRVDLHSGGWVIDFKTKDLGDDKPALYAEHFCQLAAYRVGLGLPRARCAIVFVDRSRPLAVFSEVPEGNLLRGERMFISLLAYWRARNDFYPSLVAP